MAMTRSLEAVLLLLLPLMGGASLVSSVSGALKARGDGPVVTMALCGAGRSSPTVVGEALGLAGSSTCTLVDAPTPLALIDVPSAESRDGTTAAVAADVLALEVRFTDLVERTAHGLGQLLPVLQRSVRLRDLRPQPKLLLLTVTDFDASAVSEADVKAFAHAQIADLVASLDLPAEEPPLATADLLQLQCFFVPSKVHAPESYEQGVAALRDALTSDSSSGYLLADARWSQQASSVVSTVGQASARAPAAPQAASPAEVHAAYQCSLLAEAAAREFQKGASALRKAADGTLLPDFGEQASSLVSDALSRFDADSSSFKGGAPVGAARSALKEQLQRVLYAPFRKQLAALQRASLSKLRAKVAAAKPSADIEVQMKLLLDEALAAFDASAKALLPSGVRWTYAYERASVAETMEETARAHVQTLQVQGLYLSKANAKLPIDLAAHWLLPHPFGRDSRYDPVSADDMPAYKPQAATMKLRATDGYRPKSKLADPKGMIFSDKMMQ